MAGRHSRALAHRRRVLSLVGRHLVWPAPVLARVRGFLQQRCKGNPQWKGHEALSDTAFLERHGPWRGPYEDGTLFFYIDEYIKDAPKDLLTTLATTCDWLARRLKKQNTLVEKNIDALAGLLQLNPAERALLLYGTLARYQRDLRGLLVGPMFVTAEAMFALGWSKPLAAEIERRVGPTHLRDLHAPALR